MTIEEIRENPRSSASHDPMLTSTDLAAFIAQEGIAAEIVKLPVHTPTVETAAQALGVDSAQIVKTVVFLVDSRPYLVIANGTTRVDTRKIATHSGVGRKRVKLANADAVLAITGYLAGAVPPFGHKHPLPALLDPGVLTQPVVYAGGGDIDALLRITPDELRRVTGAQLVLVSG